jgi:ubiquinone/menaquinone biosynthesis C-methylase UbiE
VTNQEARYDRIAEGYARWWSPVHRPATLGLLDAIGQAVAGGATRILDVGCGTAALAAAAVERWPGVRVTGVDASAGMLAVATRELGGLADADRDRVSLVRATADQLPFGDGDFDIVVTAFVLQLVPSRHRALREARRVLARGGTLALATWMAGGSFPADDAYADALVAAGLEPRDGGGPHDEPHSPEQAASQLRRAGFAGVTAHRDEVNHRYTPEAFLAFLACFDDEELFATLEPGAREALETDVLARLHALPPDGLRMRLPIAVVTGRRSTRP